MTKLYVSNQEAVIDTVMKEIERNTQHITIKGKAGTGKSYVMRKIAERWQRQVSNSFLWLQGDRTFQDSRDYTPFFDCFLKNTKLKENFRGFTKKTILSATKAAPYGTADLLEHIFDSILNKEENNLQLLNQSLDQKELDILCRLLYVIGNDNYLIFIDDLRWWDIKSINLLKFILKRRSSSISFLENVKFILTLSENETEQELEILLLLRELGNSSYTINCIVQDEFETTLRCIGLKKVLDKEVLELLFTFTGENLNLIKQSVIYVNSSDLSSLHENITWLHDGHLEFLIEERLKSYGDDGKLVTEVLKYASIFGLSFSFVELENSTRRNKFEIVNIIKKAKQMSLVELEQTKAKFAHEIIHALFKGKTEDNKSEYYRSCAESLKILRPGEYMTRHNLYLSAGIMEEAAMLFMLEYLRKLRKKEKIDDEFNNNVLLYSNLIRREEFALAMREAYDHYHYQRYDPCIKVLSTIHTFSVKPLQAERDYLLSLCLNKQINTDQKRQVVANLEAYVDMGSLDNEGELWSRLMSVLIVSYIHVNNFDEANKLEKSLIVELDKRAEYDIDAQDKIYILYRKAGVCHETDTALMFTQKSVSYFGPTDSSEFPLQPIEYYFALSNLVGNAILAGQFELGFIQASTLVEYIKSFQKTMSFPRQEVVINNYIICGYLAKRIPLSDALKAIHKIVSIQYQSKTDNVLISMNEAVLLAIDCQIDAANKKLTKLVERLDKYGNLENYYYYCVYSNLMVTEYLLGNKIGAMKIWDMNQQYLPVIGDRDFYRERHNLLKRLFDDNITADGADWLNVINIDAMLINEDYRWNFYKMGYLFSDIQFWSES